MNKFKKILASILGCFMLFSMTACGNENFEGESVDDVNDVLSGTLNIRMFEGGYGTAWLDNVAQAFNEKYPDVKIKIFPSTERLQILGEVTEKTDKYDIIMHESEFQDYIDCLEPIDDVYAYTNKGENKTVAEKLIPIYLDFLKTNGHYYRIPSYVGVYGLVYNADYIYDDEIPVTTDELLATCQNLKSSIKPIIFSGELGTEYWNFIYCTWFAQYEGRDAYTAALHGQAADENGEYKFNPATAYLDGGLKAMQVCEDLLWYDNGYIKSDSTGLQFIVAQREFLKGQAAIMYNGSWMFNEMQLQFPNGTDSDFKMMKVPVISAIREKCPTIKDDAELAALVRAIDAGSTALTGNGYDVGEADFVYVKNARNFYYAGAESASAVIPVNARNKTIAKRFLEVMYSEESIMRHAEAKAGNVLPVKSSEFKRELKTDNAFLKTSYGILFNNDVFFNHPVIAVTPYCTDAKANMIEKQFGSQALADRKRAADSFEAKKQLWTRNDNDKFWTELMNKGLIKERP